jgi:hypothetical protein
MKRGYLYDLVHLVEGGFVKVPLSMPTSFGILRGAGSDTSIFVRSGLLTGIALIRTQCDCSKFRDQLHFIVTPAG